MRLQHRAAGRHRSWYGRTHHRRTLQEHRLARTAVVPTIQQASSATHNHYVAPQALLFRFVSRSMPRLRVPAPVQRPVLPNGHTEHTVDSISRNERRLLPRTVAASPGDGSRRLTVRTSAPYSPLEGL